MKRFVSAALAAAISIILIPTIQATTAGADVCPAVQNFAIGGVGDPTGALTPNVPAGPRTNINYPASISPVGGNVSGDQSVRVGTDRLAGAVNDFRAQCPGSKVNLVGFSLGAVAVSDVCDSLRGEAARGVTCITSGNPKRQGQGIMGNIPSIIPGLQHTGFRVAPADGPVVVENCNARDLYCNGGNLLQDPGHFIDSAIGTYLQGQHAYPVAPAPVVVPSTPLPVSVSAYEVFEPVAEFVVPQAAFGEPYRPAPLRELVPVGVAPLLPPAVAGWIPPALPPLPVIPGLPR